MKIQVKKQIVGKFGVSLVPNKIYEATRENGCILAMVAASVWMGVKESEIIIIEDDMPEKQPFTDDDTNGCHICKVHTSGECAFDKEMNPHREPKACCGCHGCAEDV